MDYSQYWLCWGPGSLGSWLCNLDAVIGGVIRVLSMHLIQNLGNTVIKCDGILLVPQAHLLQGKFVFLFCYETFHIAWTILPPPAYTPPPETPWTWCPYTGLLGIKIMSIEAFSPSRSPNLICSPGEKLKFVDIQYLWLIPDMHPNYGSGEVNLFLLKYEVVGDGVIEPEQVANHLPIPPGTGLSNQARDMRGTWAKHYIGYTQKSFVLWIPWLCDKMTKVQRLLLDIHLKKTRTSEKKVFSNMFPYELVVTRLQLWLIKLTKLWSLKKE